MASYQSFSGLGGPLSDESDDDDDISATVRTQGYDTERSSAYSWLDDGFDRKTTEAVSVLFYQILGSIYEDDGVRTTSSVGGRECNDWSSTFPHFRIVGEQVAGTDSTNCQSPPPNSNNSSSSEEEIIEQHGVYFARQEKAAARRSRKVKRLRRINSVSSFTSPTVTTSSVILSNLVDHIIPTLSPLLLPVFRSESAASATGFGAGGRQITTQEFRGWPRHDAADNDDDERDDYMLPPHFQLDRGASFELGVVGRQLDGVLQISSKQINSRNQEEGLGLSSALITQNRPVSSMRVPSARVRTRPRLAPIKPEDAIDPSKVAQSSVMLEGLRGTRLATGNRNIVAPLPPIALDQQFDFKHLRKGSMYAQYLQKRLSSRAASATHSNRLAPDMYSNLSNHPSNTRNLFISGQKRSNTMTITGNSLGGLFLSSAHSTGIQTALPEEDEEYWTNSARAPPTPSATSKTKQAVVR